MGLYLDQISGFHYWGRILQNIVLTEYYSLTYRRGGSSAKILFWASKKRREFQNARVFYLGIKNEGGDSLEGINYLEKIDTKYSGREVLLEVGGGV